MRIGLLATLRDEITSLPRFFSLLEALEADSRVDRLFCSFYENDSSDGTPERLSTWLNDRPGLLQSERLGVPRLRGREMSRTIRMAEARNKALAGFADERLDWLVVMDADLYANPRHIWQLIEVLQRDGSVAMACASSCRICPTSLGAVPGAITTVMHCLIRTTGWGSREPLFPCGICMIGPAGWLVVLFRCGLHLVGLQCCACQRSGPIVCAGTEHRVASTGHFVFVLVRPAK